MTSSIRDLTNRTIEVKLFCVESRMEVTTLRAFVVIRKLGTIGTAKESTVTAQLLL